MWKAGHSLIKQKMKETGALFGGEMSGHMFFADRFFGFDDAIYASFRLLEILGRDGRKLSEFLRTCRPPGRHPEIRIDCPEEMKFDVVRKITDYYREKFDIVDTDGVRVIAARRVGAGPGVEYAAHTRAEVRGGKPRGPRTHRGHGADRPGPFPLACHGRQI